MALKLKQEQIDDLLAEARKYGRDYHGKMYVEAKFNADVDKDTEILWKAVCLKLRMLDPGLVEYSKPSGLPVIILPVTPDEYRPYTNIDDIKLLAVVRPKDSAGLSVHYSPKARYTILGFYPTNEGINIYLPSGIYTANDMFKDFVYAHTGLPFGEKVVKS
jgi:hypothetical protein